MLSPETSKIQKFTAFVESVWMSLVSIHYGQCHGLCEWCQTVPKCTEFGPLLTDVVAWFGFIQGPSLRSAMVAVFVYPESGNPQSSYVTIRT